MCARCEHLYTHNRDQEPGRWCCCCPFHAPKKQSAAVVGQSTQQAGSAGLARRYRNQRREPLNATRCRVPLRRRERDSNPRSPLRRATLIETPPSNSAIPPQRAKPVPSEQEPPVPCVSAPNQDPIGKDDNVLILIRIGLDGGVPIGTPRSFQFSASYQYDGLRPLGSRFGAETHPNGELPSDPSTDRLTTTDQTPKLCKKPCRSSSSLRVLRRQGAAKHKRR